MLTSAQSSSLARHRRIHTGKRPYLCSHAGCLKSFCRKTTMVKHQRRSHQRGIHSSENDDSTSETGDDDSPTTPKSHHGVPWPPHMMNHHSHFVQRAQSFAEYGQHMPSGYGMPQPYAHRHSLSGGPHDYHGMPPQHHSPHPGHEQPSQQQHHGVQMLQRTPSLPQHSYFVAEQGNPGVATMNTNPHPSAAPMHPQYQHQQMPRQGGERLPLEIPYSSPANGIQNSPSSYSAASGTSSTQEGFYTHAPTAQAATYALHAASPVEQQQPQQMTAYPGHPQGQVMSQAPPPASAQQPPSQPQSATTPYPEPHGQPQAPQWYSSIPYQAPAEVTSIGPIPSFTAEYEPWKMEYADVGVQMPSARIQDM